MRGRSCRQGGGPPGHGCRVQGVAHTTRRFSESAAGRTAGTPCSLETGRCRRKSAEASAHRATEMFWNQVRDSGDDSLTVTTLKTSDLYRLQKAEF